MNNKLARKTLIERRDQLQKELKACNKEISIIERKLANPLFPKEIIEPLRKKFKALSKERVFIKDFPAKVCLSWDEGLRIDLFAELTKYPAKTSIHEYNQYKEEINQFDKLIVKTAKKLGVTDLALWNEILDC